MQLLTSSVNLSEVSFTHMAQNERAVMPRKHPFQVMIQSCIMTISIHTLIHSVAQLKQRLTMVYFFCWTQNKIRVAHQTVDGSQWCFISMLWKSTVISNCLLDVILQRLLLCSTWGWVNDENFNFWLNHPFNHWGGGGLNSTFICMFTSQV